MTLRRDGTPQRVDTAGLLATTTCPTCGLQLRAANMARHARRQHELGYVPPSRSRLYRRLSRRHGGAATYHELERQRLERDHAGGEVYVLHFGAAVADHAQHYCGWAADADLRLEEHQAGRGAALTRHVARTQGVGAMQIAWTQPGTRRDERRIKNNRRLAELCSLCRPTALAARAEHARAWRAADPFRRTQAYRRGGRTA